MVILMLCALNDSLLANSQNSLKTATNLSSDSAVAQNEKRIIVILVSQEHCEFCERIKAEILNPLIRSGEYKESILIRELFIDFDSQLVDFLGEKRPGREIAGDYGIDFTPTMLFLDHKGQPLADPMIGLSTPEYYPFYLQRSIEQAIAVQLQNANM